MFMRAAGLRWHDLSLPFNHQCQQNNLLMICRACLTVSAVTMWTWMLLVRAASQLYTVNHKKVHPFNFYNIFVKCWLLSSIGNIW